jgi:hypothetical protein
MNRKLRFFALSAALLAAVTQPAYAATGTGYSVVTVTLPDVIILDYFTSINLGLAGHAEVHRQNSYAQSNISGSDQSIDGTGELTTGTLSDASLAALRGTDITLNLRNVWAIRGLSPTGKATVSVSGPLSLTKASTTSTIGISKLKVLVDGASTSSAAASITTNLNGIQKTDATMGDVLIDLNFANTSAAGDYSGAITITAITM